MRLVSENDSLHLVEMPDWAGLGGVRYAPPTWIHVMTDQAKEELNRLNTQLVEALRNTDAAFSLGEGADGLACVRFGMVTQDTGEQRFTFLVPQLIWVYLACGLETKYNCSQMWPNYYP